MARIFTSNQVNQVYVAKAYESSKANVDTVGDIAVSKDADGSLYFTHFGKGGLTRSDLLENIMYGKAVTADSMKMKLKSVFMTLDSNNVISGRDYVINIDMQNPIGMSPDNSYFKFAAARAFSSTTKSTLLRALGVNMAKNLGVNMEDLLKVYLTMAPVTEFASTASYSKGDMVEYKGVLYVNKSGTAGTNPSTDTTNWVVLNLNPAAYDATTTSGYAVGDLVINNSIIYVDKTAISSGAAAGSFDSTKWVALAIPVAKNAKESNLTDTYTGILLVENENSDWILGLKQTDPLVFNVTASSITASSSNEIEWLETINAVAGYIKNGKIAAELEYFAMGERADQYRLHNWPNYVPTDYIVDPTKEYDIISIHFAYTGSNHAVQKSEKDITILCERTVADSTPTSLGSVASSLKSAINTLRANTVA